MSRVLSIVLAGGMGKRLRPLTLRQAKPALPFLHNRRIIDFVLSNLWHSDMHQVLVLTQYQPASLHHHLQSHWQPRFAQTGFLQLCQQPCEKELGTAGAVASILSVIRDYRPDVIAILNADHIYKMDYRQMLAQHLTQQASLTVAAVEVPLSQAAQFGIFSTDSQARITGFVEKPSTAVAQLAHRPGFALASMGNYLFAPECLYSLLQQLDLSQSWDFGQHLLPQLVASGSAQIYNFNQNTLPGRQSLPHYWRDVGTLSAYCHCKLDLLKHIDWLEGSDQAWPILAAGAGSLAIKPYVTTIRRPAFFNHRPLYQ